MSNPLTLLLDTLLPGDAARWPAAGAQGLAPRMQDQARDLPGGNAALRAVLDHLPDDFAARDQMAREAVLRGIETALPHAFDTVVTAAYNAYYTDPAIRDVVAARTGFANHPPQPQGFELPPFDAARLAQVRARPPLWRPER